MFVRTTLAGIPITSELDGICLVVMERGSITESEAMITIFNFAHSRYLLAQNLQFYSQHLKTPYQ
ncbi:hypothetical protein NIES22_62640 [Calothrix brevissima NIES-22]|nr:hypothetical protein NIES22_62640 [Calothrix brevissima NIES-22]